MEFRILGPVEVIGDLGPINLGGPQQRRILAVLLANPGVVVTYDRLIEVLWADGDPPDNARRSAISYVSRLRSAIGDGVVVTSDAGYLIDVTGLNIDATRFAGLLDLARNVESARAVDVLDEALALWRGPVYGDLTGEWWARPMVSRLEELKLVALGERIDALAADGWSGRALAEVAALVSAHPLREQFVERAMRGLHSVGQSADALRVFQTYRNLLVEQTGLDPSTSLVELDRSIAGGVDIDAANTRQRSLRGYVLRELIGEGSFGSVYRATQPGVARDVALKVVRSDLVDDRSFVMRFEAEAQLVAHLEHPHIVPLYDFWREPGGAYLVFRLLRGGNAEQALTLEGPLTLERVTLLVEHVGAALVAAHQAGVVHRDVKPGNILFDEAGSAYLADFGIAGLASPVDTPQARRSVGSPLYASPEQLREGAIDARADQYALAITVWELLVGHAPFVGADASAVMHNKLASPVPSLVTLRPDLPTGLDSVIARATAVHPDDRYVDVGAFLLAWRAAVQASTVAVTDPTIGADRAHRATAATMLGPDAVVANPYKGLRPFREADAREFAGRDGLVDRLGDVVSGHGFVAVVGPSGSGKSSLVMAGLVPRLRRDGCLVVMLTPGDDPFAAASEAFRMVATDDQAVMVSPASMRVPTGLRDASASVAADGRLVIIIDQFEELWTLTAADDRDRFADALRLLGTEKSVRVVATIRADLFDRPLRDPMLGPLVADNTFAVTAMTAEELHESITRPGEQLGVRFDSALTSRLVAEAIDQPGSLPLLQFALTELFDRRRGATIGTDVYDEMGGLSGALSHQADEIYQRFNAADRAATRVLFSRLVTPGEGNEDTRRRARATELGGVPTHVVDAFVSRRLLTTDHDRETREPTIEVAHEVLLRAWPRLRGWLDEDRAWLRELRGLASAAVAWDSAGRDDADLLRGTRLAVVDELAAQHGDALTDLEQRYLAAARARATADQLDAERRAADQARQNRRLRRTLVGLAAVLVVALLAGALALVQRQRADRSARSARAATVTADEQRAAAVTAAGQATAARDDARLTTLASRSLSLRSSQRDLAALLGVEAWRRRADASAKSALFATFTTDPGFLGFQHLDNVAGTNDTDSVNGVPIPGTTKFLIDPRHQQGATLAMRTYDLASGTTGPAFESLADNLDYGHVITISGDGRRAAEMGWPNEGTRAPGSDAGAGRLPFPVVAVFDVASGHRITELIHVPFDGESVALDATGSHLVVAGGADGRAVAYDVPSGSVVAQIPGVPGAPPSDFDNDVASVAYAPDGRLYLGSSGTELRVLDPTTFAVVDTITVPLFSTGFQLKFTNDGSILVANGINFSNQVERGQQGAIVAIDIAHRNVLWSLTGDQFGYGGCSAFAVDGAGGRLWCGDFFGLIRERALQTGALTGRTFAHQKGKLEDLFFVDAGPGQGQGQELVSLGGNAAVIGRWRVDGGGPIERIVAPRQLHGELSPDGTRLLTTVFRPGPNPFNNLYSIWDATTGAKIASLDDLVFAGWSGEGHTLFAAFTDLTAGVFDTDTMQRTALSISLNPVPSASAPLAHGKFMALGYDDGTVAVFDVATGDLAFPKLQAASGVFQITADPTASRIFVSTDGNGLSVFDSATGRLMAGNTELSTVSVAVSRSGTVAIGRTDGRLGLYDPVTLQQVASLPGARGFVQQLQFSDDGTVLMGMGNDNSVSLYDVATATRIGDPIVLPSVLTSWAALTPDGHEMTTTYPEGGAVTIWDLDPEHWVTAACAIAGRNLTREEWTTYIGDLGSYRATCPQYSAAV